MRCFAVSILLAGLGLCATSVQAGLFQGATSGVFSEPTGGTSAVWSGVGTNTFTTGNAQSGSSPNSLSYSAVSFTADVDEYVRLGNLEYYNGRTDTGTAVDSVPLDLQVSFAQPFSDSFSLDYGFDFYVTPNTTGDNTRDADSLFLLPQLNQTTFDYNYSQYSLELVGFSDNDGSTISNVFLLPEDSTVNSGLYGRITTAPTGGSFQGSVEGLFGTPDASSGAVYSGVGSSVFSSGDAIAGSLANEVEFKPVNFSTNVNESFLVGYLAYTNGRTSLGTNVDSVPLDISFAFDDPSIISDIFTFAFDFDITTNSTGDPILDADSLFLLSQESIGTFTQDNRLYSLELLGFSTDLGLTAEDTFVLPEDQTVFTGLYARISAVPVPASGVLLVASGVLLVLGLFLMAPSFVFRRRAIAYQ